MSEQKDQIASAVGHIPSGLFIVCSRNNESGRIDGFLGSWIQQVSFDPLLISLCIKPGRPASDGILEGQPFSINIVGEHEKGYLKHFWSGYDPEKNPFDEIDHEVNEDGLVTLKDAKSVIFAKKCEALNPGDHHLVISEVLNSQELDSEAKPMVHIRKSGLSY